MYHSTVFIRISVVFSRIFVKFILSISQKMLEDSERLWYNNVNVLRYVRTINMLNAETKGRSKNVPVY